MHLVYNYFKDLLALHKKVIGSIPYRLEQNGSDQISIAIRNLKTKLKGLNHRFLFDKEKNYIASLMVAQSIILQTDIVVLNCIVMVCVIGQTF